MITTEKALEIVLSQPQTFGSEKVGLTDALGRILAENITADRDLPPFDRITMDGIAIRYEDFEKGYTKFKITGVAAAGSPQHILKENGNCLEVMTGAMLPEESDTIIPYEQVSIQNGVATLLNKIEVKKYQNLHRKGIDHVKDDMLLHAGHKIKSTTIGICATVGKTVLEVFKIPKTVIISTGNELVSIDQQPEAFQIRTSNAYQLHALFSRQGIDADKIHLQDEMGSIRSAMIEVLKNYDLVLLSGGVSKGKFDFIPEVLTELGVKNHFHGVSQRPGKPIWFGTKDQKTIFALPGNPVSTFVCTLKYVLPWIHQATGQLTQSTVYAQLAEDFRFDAPLTYFLEVQVSSTPSGFLIATPSRGNGSGDLSNLSKINGFLELPKDQSSFKKGESLTL